MPDREQAKSDYQHDRIAAEDDALRRDQATSTRLAVIDQKLTYITASVDDVKTQLKNNTVNPDKFANLVSRVSLMEKIVYGFVGLILISVVTALLALLLHVNTNVVVH
jgi:hypothetical protein